MQAHLLNIEGLAFQYLEDLPEAIRSFEAAVTAGERTGRTSDCFFAYTNLAFTEVVQGRLHRAHALCQQVLSLAERDSAYIKGVPVLAYAYSTLSLVQLEWNQLEAAVASARQGVALAEKWRQADTLHYSLSCLSKALCAAGDLEEALAANQRTMRLAADVSPWFFRLSAVDEVFLYLEKGDLPAAARRFAELEPLVEERNQSGRFLELKAALRYAQQRYAEAVTELEKAIEVSGKRETMWFLLSYLPLQALALQTLGREEEAIQAIGRCLSMAKAEGFTRVFVGHGAAMLRLLQVTAGRGIEVGYINQLIPAFGIGTTPVAIARPASAATPQPAPGTALIEPLSERELQVLRLLDSPLTSEEIGRELYVSANTVRTHIRNIYGKLDVHGRLEAIQKARDLKLI
jgi:LuxR family maltose regulon positive regulatory protein